MLKNNSVKNLILKMQKAKNFPDNTCPASRHVQLMAEELAKNGEYHMIQEDPKHVAGSLASVVASLYETRDFLRSIGYAQQISKDGKLEWLKMEDATIEDVKKLI